MKKLSKRNGFQENTVEAFETRARCTCACVCSCACQVQYEPSATTKKDGYNEDKSDYLDSAKSAL